MYCEGTVGILDENDCRAATHVFIYTQTPSAADPLRLRDGTQWAIQSTIQVSSQPSSQITNKSADNQPTDQPVI